MSKTVIVGITSSGKTCYFYGMLQRMMHGYQGFSIRVAPKDFGSLRKGMKRLADTSLPLEERLPQPSSKQENYPMDLLYNLKKIDTFEWVDYPGELAEEGTEEFVNLLDGATCLLLCVDGEALQGEELDLDEVRTLLDKISDDNREEVYSQIGRLEFIKDIIDNIFNERGGMELCHALQQAESRYENGFPPVCIMVTKYDKVSPELRDMEIITNIMQESFPVLFHEGNGHTRMVTICPVTLGKELNNNGRLQPKNVEKPICFANYLIQTAVLENRVSQANDLVSKNQQEVAEYNKRSWLGKKLNPKPTPMTEEQKQAIQELLSRGKADLDALRSVIESLPLYINGVEAEWPD